MEPKADPGLKDSLGAKGRRAPQARKVQRELEGRQEDLDRDLLGHQDPRPVNDPVPQGILENEGYSAIPVILEMLEHRDRGEEKDTTGFQEIGGSKAEKGMPETPVRQVL